ncbi:MAG TPA: PilZ domain-containing protein [Labilithrix sp.]|nr:PilZ domain-containing protein [Labilithrix sp.]
MVEEKRRHARVPVEISLFFQVKGRNRERPGIGKDISLGGMFIETPEPAPFSSELLIRVRLPGSDQSFLLRSVVRWETKLGMGVQFGLLGAVETHLITEITRHYGRANPP